MSNGLDYVATNLVTRTLMEPGATISLFGSPAPIDGFYVGGAVESLVFPDLHAVRFGPVRELLEGATSDYVGFWTDDDTGQVYFDLVDWYQDEEEALKVARDRNELAIWSVAGDLEIRLSE